MRLRDIDVILSKYYVDDKAGIVRYIESYPSDPIIEQIARLPVRIRSLWGEGSASTPRIHASHNPEEDVERLLVEFQGAGNAEWVAHSPVVLVT